MCVCNICSLWRAHIVAPCFLSRFFFSVIPSDSKPQQQIELNTLELQIHTHSIWHWNEHVFPLMASIEFDTKPSWKEDENPAGSDVSYLTRVSVRPTWAFAHNKVLGWRRKREEFLLAVSHFHFHYFAHASTWKTFIPVVLCGHKRLIRIFRLGFVSITFRALNLIIKKCAFFFWCDSSDGGQQMRAAGVELWEERGREIRGE